LSSWTSKLSTPGIVFAIDAGSFVDEIIPISVPKADGTTVTFATAYLLSFAIQARPNANTGS